MFGSCSACFGSYWAHRGSCLTMIIHMRVPLLVWPTDYVEQKTIRWIAHDAPKVPNALHTFGNSLSEENWKILLWKFVDIRKSKAPFIKSGFQFTSDCFHIGLAFCLHDAVFISYLHKNAPIRYASYRVSLVNNTPIRYELKTVSPKQKNFTCPIAIRNPVWN